MLVWHYQQFLFVGSAPVGLVTQAQPFFPLLAPLYRLGYAGVELFWALSGFIFAWKYADAIHAGAVGLGRFVWLRASRLYPLHLATLLAVAALNPLYYARHGVYFVYVYNDLKDFLLNLAFASYWGLQDGYSFNGPSWSISAEMLVYLLFFGLSRIVVGALWSAGLTAVVISITASLLRASIGWKWPVFGAATFFYLGVVTCHLHVWIAGRSERFQAVASGLAALATLGPALLVGVGWVRIAGASIVMFPAAILFFQMVVPDRFAALNRLVTGLGNLTYASYMLHFPMQLAAVLVLDALGIAIAPLFYTHWFFLAYLATVLAASWLVFHGFERPAQDALRRRQPAWRVRRQATSSASREPVGS